MTWVAVWIALLLAQAPGASIEGVVVRAGTNEPIAGAQVGVGNSPRVTTDQTGRFSIKDLRAGSYTLSVLSNGYARHVYGQRQPGGPGAPITLTQGQALNLTIPMTPAGNINGRIRSADGRPISGITVRLVRRSYTSSGRRTFDTVASVRSDDRGAYRFYWATPGRYYVMAGLPSQGQGSLRSESDNTNENIQNYPYTFFPGSTEVEKAVAIDVRPGAEVDGIDFALADARLYRIRARVIDPATGQPPPRATASISYWSINGGGSSSGGDRYDPKTGIAEFKDVMPGAYTVGVVAAGYSNGVPGRSTPEASAGADVLVSNADVDLGLLRLELPNVIAGRITGDPLPPDATTANAFEVSLIRESAPGSIDPSGRGVRPQPDGSFTANFSYPSLRVTAPRLPPGFYVREAKLDGADALTGYARVSRSSNLEVVMSSKAAQVEGIIRDDRSQPAAGVTVVLVPDVGRGYPERFKEIVTDQNGRFSIASIPPGDYKVFAWEVLEPYGYFDPDVLRKHEQRGRPVRLVESSRETVDLRMIPAGVE
jgi:hypothetical protein